MSRPIDSELLELVYLGLMTRDGNPHSFEGQKKQREQAKTLIATNNVEAVEQEMKYLEEQVNYWKRTIEYGDEVVNVSVIKQHLQSVKDRLTHSKTTGGTE